ncbi:MAG: polysaccharide pyruvyl transferase CsaB [Armatimonadetes bacterium]|nr:polysaccharide pyruvyl transferase CsaB [Armatimonadota bacterium]
MARRKILISGYYGFGNAGDEAILAAMLQAIHAQRDDLEVCVFSDNPALTSREFGVRAVNRKNLFAMGMEMLSASLLLSGGGGLIQDSTGVNTIRYYMGVASLARTLGTPVMFYAQGVGPIRTQAGRGIARTAANRVQLITVRDDESRALFEEIGVTRPPIVVTADPVMALEPAPAARVDEIWKAEALAGDSPVVGLSVRPWPESQGYEEAFAEAGRRIVREGARVLVIPFQESQDRAVCERVAEAIGGGAHLLSDRWSATELMGVMGRLQATVAMRLHALIFSAALAVPMAGVAYDPKVAQFLARMEAPVIPLQGLSPEHLHEAARDLLERGGLHRDRLRRLAPPMRDQALENARLMDRLLRGEAPR